MTKLIDLGPLKTPDHADLSPDEFRNRRNRFEKRLQDMLDEYVDTLRKSEVVDADEPAITERFVKRWNSECDVADKGGIPFKRDAFIKQVEAMREREARKKVFAGPLCAESLQLVGFRKWSDGTWRTREIVVEPRGSDWNVRITKDLIDAHRMPFLMTIMGACGIKQLTPYHEPTTTTTKRNFIARLLGKA